MIILDGGMGTALEDLGCKIDSKLWSAEILAKQPELVQKVHEQFFAAGAQIATTCSYQASIQGFKEAGYSGEEARMFLRNSIQLAQNAKQRCGRRDLKIAFSMGCYGAYLGDGSEFTGRYDGAVEATIVNFHRERFEAVKSLDFDILLFETIPNLIEARSINSLLNEIDFDRPIWISFSCKDDKSISDGSLLIEECLPIVFSSKKVSAVGFNCTDLAYAEGLVEKLKSAVQDRAQIICYPNKGEIYEAKTKTWNTKDGNNLQYPEVIKNCVLLGADIVGGCCRVAPNDIELLCG